MFFYPDTYFEGEILQGTNSDIESIDEQINPRKRNASFLRGKMMLKLEVLMLLLVLQPLVVLQPLLPRDVG